MQASPTISPFQTPQSSSLAGAAAAAGSKSGEKDKSLSAVDFQNFLTLLTAQLRNQDPLDPADSTEFVAQLAQFTSVEQQVLANSKLDSIASSMIAGGIDKYAGWIGREAEALSAPAWFDGATPVKFRLSGDPAAASVETVISDKTGKEIARFRAVNSNAVQTWNGIADGTPVAEGAYAVTAIYYGSNGSVIGEEIANTFGGVREVRLNDGSSTIVLDGGVELEPNQVAGLGLKE
jgi:flagellar basal-body rod modification protein FlgD